MADLGNFMTSSGQMVSLRLLQKSDAALLVDLFYRLSAESKRLRFHLYSTKLPEELVWQGATTLSDLDQQTQLAIIATIRADDGQEQAVGVVRFARESIEAGEAEVAIVVRDDFQRKGLGKHLLRLLAGKARQMGITHFTGWVMAYNLRLLKLIESMEEIKDIEADSRHGEIKIRVPIV